MPGFVPPRFAPPLARAAQRWNVSATLLAAQLYAESGFNPFAVSTAGARGIAQFMPGTASAYGLRDPFDAGAAIDAQAHLMRDLLRRFAAVPLALAAYNAGPAPVAACGCVPPIAETRGYVARILGLMGGAGELVGPGRWRAGGAAGGRGSPRAHQSPACGTGRSSWRSAGGGGAGCAARRRWTASETSARRSGTPTITAGETGTPALESTPRDGRGEHDAEAVAQPDRPARGARAPCRSRRRAASR